MFYDLKEVYKIVLIFTFMGMTFGVWKILEIIIWVLTHISVSIH